MTEIQAVLILFSLLAATFASLLFRSRLWYRLLALFFSVTAISFVIFPNATNVIAHHLGVVRGADLLLYLTVFAGIHAFLLLYAKLRKLEQKLTGQVRFLAISNGQLLSADSTQQRTRAAVRG
ncbi:MAG TPA: DUF2304 domain-containing protein [Bryobacteraceae bacterium]|nr:DUF2304 domain-containing protein [Bryobacteraceae bacterium]